MPDFQWIWEDLQEYESHLKQLVGKQLSEAHVLEIGYGARPLRLIALQSMNVDATGIDLDAPVLRGDLREFVRIIQQNGPERCLKSVARYYLFDRKERRALAAALRARGFALNIDEARFLVGDAASDELDGRIPAHSLDLVLSEDVFEHIPRRELRSVASRIAAWLKRDGIALIRPNIFTGITGGHHLEWYAHQVAKEFQRRTEPWEHLRQRRFAANTFLNELSRAEYRELFRLHFDILDEQVAAPDLGRKFLTAEVRQELGHLSEDELFSNRVLFVLRRKP